MADASALPPFGGGPEPRVQYDRNMTLPGYRDPGFGTRRSGTPKGLGYFGPIRGPGEDELMTELSGEDEIDGETVEFPLMVPTLTHEQLSRLVYGDRSRDDLRDVYDEARAHAKARMALGRSVWAEPGEMYPVPDPDPDYRSGRMRK